MALGGRSRSVILANAAAVCVLVAGFVWARSLGRGAVHMEDALQSAWALWLSCGIAAAVSVYSLIRGRAAGRIAGGTLVLMAALGAYYGPLLLGP